MRRRLPQDRFAVGAKIEQRITLRRDRVAVERSDVLRTNAVVDVFDLEQRTFNLIGVQGNEPTGNLQPCLEKGLVSHIVRLGDRHTVRIPECPVETGVQGRSTVASSKRAAPVIRVASSGWKKDPGFSTFPRFEALAKSSGKPSFPLPKQAKLCLRLASSTINSTKMP